MAAPTSAEPRKSGHYYLITQIALTGLLLFSAGLLHCYADQSSLDYLVMAHTIDSGGAVARSTTYSLRGSAIGGSGVGADAVLSNGTYAGKSGFVGQLYRLKALQVVSDSQTVNEGSTVQLNVLAQADDDTIFAPLDPILVTWSVVNGPLVSVSENGVVTADRVYQLSPATVAVSRGSLRSQLQLNVLNISNDDFGSYAGDQIDDDWQVQYFGLPPNPAAAPDVDADGTGQSNLLKFLAGLNPLDGSRFTVVLKPVPGNESQMDVVFNPIVAGRSYAVQSLSDPASSDWHTLQNAVQTDRGAQRTVIDLQAGDSPKFYRVQISRP